MSLDEKFLRSAAAGMLCDCLDLLSCGADLYARGHDGLYAWDLAAISGDSDTCVSLIECGVDRGLDLHGPLLNATMGYAAYHGHINTVRALIDLGASVNVSGVSGWTPLHDAALVGRTEICALLVGHGADLNARCSEGQTPLHKAVRSMSVQVCSNLIESGSEIHARDIDGNSVLSFASRHSTDSINLLLIAYGADASEAMPMYKKRTPAQCCALLGLTSRMLYLMENDLTKAGDEPSALSSLAAKSGHHQTASAVLAYGAMRTIQQVRQTGGGPCHRALSV